MRIGLLADSHLPSLVRSLDELGPQIGDFLSGVDLILHAGDVTAPAVLDWCEQYAPVLVSRGNNDLFSDRRMGDRQLLDVEGFRIGLVHELRPESRPVEALLASSALRGERVDVLIAGDTHADRLEFRSDVVFLNPGSPTLPRHKETRLGTVGLLEIEPGRLHAEIVTLGETPGAPNPGTARHIEIEDGRPRRASLRGRPVRPEDLPPLG
ncbi:MAG: metallophosphoesterase family protein [Myxococcota bacterium]